MKISTIQAQIHTPLPFLQRFGTGIVPDPSTLLQDGDVVYAAVEVERVPEVERLLAAPPARR
jgi:trk system potassium uptake protein TrkA